MPLQNGSLPIDAAVWQGQPSLNTDLYNRALSQLGHTAFRPGQQEAIDTLLEFGKLLLVAPTGGGKSLTYQLPALMFSGTTVVVSPLIALMHDQVDGLVARGVAATYLASTLAPEELNQRLARAARGEYRLLYVAPERLQTPSFRRMLAQLDCPLIAIDEAHCISEWGHDFRPEYLAISNLLQQLPKARVLACTATATPVVRDEILTRLRLDAKTPQLIHGFERPNLSLGAEEVRSGAQRQACVDGLLADVLGSPANPRGAVIVYAMTRRAVDTESLRLQSRGWKAGGYHAGLDAEERTRVQQDFAESRLDVVVATNAFGMGIDRGDVRAVVHLSPPSSVEAYYQEVGRAGRDGQPATGLLLVSPQDIPMRRFLMEATASENASAGLVEHKWSLFLELLRWVESPSCRYTAILRYFGTRSDGLEDCGRCDVCQGKEPSVALDATETRVLIQKALSGVGRIHGRFGLSSAVQLLSGVRNKRLVESGLTDVPTFGMLRKYGVEWVTRLLQRCITAGWVSFAGQDRPVAVLTEQGKDVMMGRAQATLLFPPLADRMQGLDPKRSNKVRAKSMLSSAASAVFEALREHRMQLASEQGVPPYVIASDRTLRDMVELRPSSEDQLHDVYGMGPTRIERYGAGFLQVLEAHGDE